MKQPTRADLDLLALRHSPLTGSLPAWCSVCHAPAPCLTAHLAQMALAHLDQTEQRNAA